MWVSNRIFDWFKISQESFNDIRQELAALKAERDRLVSELAALRITSDWMRMQVNQLQVENKTLMEKAYNIRVPVPEIVRRSEPNLFNLQDLFNDVGDEQAQEMGYKS